MKDFQKWHIKKTNIQNTSSDVYFYEREVWWMYLGSNVGFEEDGKGEDFLRPVVVLKKFNRHMFLGIPVSTTQKRSQYHFPFLLGAKNCVALLSQIRVFDSRRFLKKIAFMTLDDYSRLKNSIRGMIS